MIYRYIYILKLERDNGEIATVYSDMLIEASNRVEATKKFWEKLENDYKGSQFYSVEVVDVQEED